MHRSAATLLFLAAAAPLAAQAPGAPASPDVRRAVGTITEADFRRRVMLLADDSMGGRGTPSPGLEMAAAYIASEFRRLGLRPGGDDGSFMQRYRMVRQAPDTAGYAMAMGGGAESLWRVGRDAALLAGSLPGPRTAPLVVVAGMPADTARPFGDVPLRGSVVLHYVHVQQVSRRGLFWLARKAAAAGALGFVVAPDYSSPQWAALLRGTARARLEMSTGDDAFPVLAVRDSSAAAIVHAAGLDPATARGTWRVVAPRGMEVRLDLTRRVIEEHTAPNVIGILEGSDPRLSGEYVFFTAHMDHVGVAGAGNGCTAQGADSICNGADDDASGTVGILELAEAYASLATRPRRSLVFMTVSGEERGLWGSEYYSEHPTVPLESTVAALNMDMIGRNWRDTISVIGKEHSSLGEVANRVTRQHPELGMRLVDDLWPSENFYRRSDHFNFARKGVPILFFFNGVHADYHRPSDSPDRIDAEKAARIVRMLFYIGLDVADTTERPQWNPASRREIVEGSAR